MTVYTARVRGGVGQMEDGRWVTLVELTDVDGSKTLYMSEARYPDEEEAKAAYAIVRKPLMAALESSGGEVVQLAPPDGYVEFSS